MYQSAGTEREFPLDRKSSGMNRRRKERVNRMDDLISRQAAIDAFYVQSDDDGWWVGTCEDFEIFINGLPTIQERKKGTWEYPFTTTKMIRECSVCGRRTGGGLNPYNFCPNCGADMR